MKPRQHPFEGAPVAGAPGWYVVRRTAPVPSGDPLRWARRFRLTAVAVTVGLVALVLVLSMVRAHWSEAPAEHAVVIAMPPLAISPGTGAAPGPPLAPNAPIEEPARPRNTLAAVALHTKTDPVLADEFALLPLQSLPDEFALLPLQSLEALERLTEWESRSRAVGAAPSAAPLQSTTGGSPSRTQEPRGEPVQPIRSLPGADPATLGPADQPHVASEASTSEDHSALPTGEIRIFIHHVVDHQEDATMAERLADYLRSEGFTVADIRPVEFSIGKPSVRYFFARDRAASQRLVDELGRFFERRTSLAPDQASDFTHFLPKPNPGNVEVWLPAS